MLFRHSISVYKIFLKMLIRAIREGKQNRGKRPKIFCGQGQGSKCQPQNHTFFDPWDVIKTVLIAGFSVNFPESFSTSFCLFVIEFSTHGKNIFLVNPSVSFWSKFCTHGSTRFSPCTVTETPFTEFNTHFTSRVGATTG